MKDLLTPISDISIIVAIESIGPVLKTSTSKEIIDSQTDASVVLYFTQRVVFSLGFGNEQVEFQKFHGPLTLMKSKSDKGLLLPIKFKDNNSTDSRIKNFGRDVIIVIHFFENDYKLIQDFQQDLLSKSLNEIEKLCPNFDYIHLNEKNKMNLLSKTLKENLNRFSGLRIWAENKGSSLLHLGTLNKLQGTHRDIGAILIDSLNGLSFEKIKSNLNDCEETTRQDSIQDLIDRGFMEEKIEENTILYIVK
ncbi:MAG: hypothetical protein ACXACX_06745 [Candidatus Hodarchaeales archaeon]|jgi:hypothetical protein